jgi:hypothetical protein
MSLAVTTAATFRYRTQGSLFGQEPTMAWGEVEVDVVIPHVLISTAAPDLPEVAGYYSQLAGVLAGFSFAALVALVASKRESGNGPRVRWYCVAPLTSAFVALVASSLDYALVAGETAGTNRVAAVQTTAGMGFSVAGIMLVYSVLALLADYGFGQSATGLLKNLTVVILPPLLVLLMWSGVRDHVVQLNPGHEDDFFWADWVALVTLLVVTGVVSTFRLRFRTSPTDQRKLVTRLANATSQVAFLSLIGTASLISLTTDDASIPDFIPILAMLVVAAFAVAVAYSASRYETSSEWDEEPIAPVTDIGLVEVTATPAQVRDQPAPELDGP